MGNNGRAVGSGGGVRTRRVLFNRQVPPPRAVPLSQPRGHRPTYRVGMRNIPASPLWGGRPGRRPRRASDPRPRTWRRTSARVCPRRSGPLRPWGIANITDAIFKHRSGFLPLMEDVCPKSKTKAIEKSTSTKVISRQSSIKKTILGHPPFLRRLCHARRCGPAGVPGRLSASQWANAEKPRGPLPSSGRGPSAFQRRLGYSGLPGPRATFRTTLIAADYLGRGDNGGSDSGHHGKHGKRCLRSSGVFRPRRCMAERRSLVKPSWARSGPWGLGGRHGKAGARYGHAAVVANHRLAPARVGDDT